jgi:hypothetical protein
MRRVMLMLAVVAMIVSLFAVAAYAADIRGTDNGETITESERDDNIRGNRGGDLIKADEYTLDQTPGGLGDKDNVKGNRGDDEIHTDDGDPNDTVNGGPGVDECHVNPGDIVTNCELIDSTPL